MGVGCVYIIESTEFPGRCKIGVTHKTSGMSHRVASIASSSGTPVHVAHRIECRWPDSLEYSLHHLLDDRNVYGEWFMLSKEDMAWIKSIDDPRATGKPPEMTPEHHEKVRQFILDLPAVPFYALHRSRRIRRQLRDNQIKDGLALYNAR